MGKVTVLLAAFLAFLLIAEASIYRTTVILDEEADQNPRTPRGRGCQEQFQQQQRLFHCQEFLRQQLEREGRRPRHRDELEDIVNQRFGQEHFQQCCEQLEQMDSECRCDGLRQVVQQQQQRGQFGREEMREAFQTASNLPSQCNLSPGRCQFGSRGWF